MRMTEIDIDKLLSDDEPDEEKGLKEATPADQEKPPEKKAEETQESKKEKVLKRELRKRQEEIERLKAMAVETDGSSAQSAEQTQELVINENDPAVKAWLKKIDEKTDARIKPILDANFKKAFKRFIENHPEYSLPERKAQLKECVERTKGKVEEDDIYSSLGEHWASQNFHELEKIASQREQSRSNAQRQALHSSSVGEGVKQEDDFTEEERTKAEKLDMSVEDYRRALAGYKRNSLNFTG